MTVSINQIPAKVTASGIRTGTIIRAGSETASLKIYAKPCSPYTFELFYTHYDGTTYSLQHNDSLPVEVDFNLEDIMAVAMLAEWIKDNAQVVKPER